MGVLAGGKSLREVPAEEGEQPADRRHVPNRPAALDAANGAMADSGEAFELRDGKSLALPEEPNSGSDGDLFQIGNNDQVISDCFSNE